jgi:carboxylesterase type B
MQDINFDFPSGSPSEDCLFLNIRTPTLNSSANLPVMIWVHGGNFRYGSSTQRISFYLSLSQVYDGSCLAMRGVVIITINYRLGVFGFFNGNSSDSLGNQGLWDQAMALNWTRQHIAAFGGNPNDITLFGQSAGSMSISNHIVSNVTRNWFQKAILESGIHYSMT